MKILLTITTALVLLMSGCGSKEGVKSEAQKSYLYFSGNTSGAMVSVDKGEEFSVKAGVNNQYGVRPGKHLVEISRNGVIIIKREIYLGDGMAKEIEVE